VIFNVIPLKGLMVDRIEAVRRFTADAGLGSVSEILLLLCW
jgi:hypothetical protein